MNKLKTTGLGGFPFVLDDTRQFLGRLSGSEGIYQAFNNILGGFGNNFIVQGVVASGSSPNVAITEGWVLLDGELIKVDAQTGIDTTTDNKFVKVTTFDSRGNKTFQNGTIEDTYEINRAVVQGTSGNLDFDGDKFEWQEAVFSSGDFFASSGVWAVIGPSTEIRTHLLGKMMTMSIFVDSSTLSGGPSANVEITIPRGKTANNVMTNLGQIIVGGTPAVAIIETSASGSGIKIRPLDGSNFPNGSLIVKGQITFQVN